MCPNSGGVAIRFKKGVDCTIHSKILDPLGRYIILEVETKDKMYLLINVCAPNKDKCIVNFFHNLLVLMKKPENIIMEEISIVH